MSLLDFSFLKKHGMAVPHVFLDALFTQGFGHTRVMLRMVRVEK